MIKFLTIFLSGLFLISSAHAQNSESLEKEMVKVEKLLAEKKHKAEINPTQRNRNSYLSLLKATTNLHRAIEVIKVGELIK